MKSNEELLKKARAGLTEEQLRKSAEFSGASLADRNKILAGKFYKERYVAPKPNNATRNGHLTGPQLSVHLL